MLGVMEAMKMELSLTAPFAGTVDVRVSDGEQVALGATLFVVTELSDAQSAGTDSPPDNSEGGAS